jgi:hypothetical protein
MRTILAIAAGALLAIGVVSFEARNPSALDMDKYRGSMAGMFGSVFTIVPKSPNCGAACGFHFDHLFDW